MGRKARYNIGDIVNGRKFIERTHDYMIVQCLSCGKRAKTKPRIIEKNYCKCGYGRTNGLRYSGLRYENTEERLNELKEKYRNGIPEGEIERWILKEI